MIGNVGGLGGRLFMVLENVSLMSNRKKKDVKRRNNISFWLRKAMRSINSLLIQ